MPRLYMNSFVVGSGHHHCSQRKRDVPSCEPSSIDRAVPDSAISKLEVGTSPQGASYGTSMNSNAFPSPSRQKSAARPDLLIVYGTP